MSANGRRDLIRRVKVNLTRSGPKIPAALLTILKNYRGLLNILLMHLQFVILTYIP